MICCYLWQLTNNIFLQVPLQWGAADAEIKVPSDESTEFKRSPFKAWSRSVYSRTCYACCQGFLPCLFLPFQSIHLHFFPKPLPIFPVLAVAYTWFLCRPTEWIRSICQRQVPVLSAHGIETGTKLNDLWYDDLWNDWLGNRVKFVFSPDVILCGWLGSKHQLTS